MDVADYNKENSIQVGRQLKDLLFELEPEGSHTFFRDFTDTMFAHLLDDIRVVKLAEQSNFPLFSPGDSADFFYFVLNGELEVTSQLAVERHKQHSYYGFEEESGQTRRAQATSQIKTEVLEINDALTV